MKKLLCALAFIACSVQAETWFEMPNKAGGKILLLMEKCSKSEGRMVIATTPDGTNVGGCWFYFADMVHIVWTDAGAIKTSTFDPKDFQMRERK
jgi:hypothetical protein